MTLIVGVAHPSGVLMACDSASSDADDGSKLLVNKIHQLPGHPILVGGSGHVSVIQNCLEKLNTLPQRDSFKNYRSEIKKNVVIPMKEAVDLHVPHPTQAHHLPPSCCLLAVGVTKGQPWILEIERTGEDTEYGAPHGRFAAIGSGKASANAIALPHRYTERDERLAKVLAYRVLADSIEMAAGGLAYPIHMYHINQDGAVSRVSDEELEMLKTTREVWRGLEAEALGKLFAPVSEDLAPEDPVPLP